MKTLQRLTWLLLLAVLVGGCELVEDDFLGTWESYAYYDGYEETGLYPDEYCTYAFFRDGTGIYSRQNSINGRMYETDFRWQELSRGHLYLRHSDGEVEDFYYRFRGGDMLVSSTPSFHTYMIYAYRGRHY